MRPCVPQQKTCREATKKDVDHILKLLTHSLKGVCLKIRVTLKLSALRETDLLNGVVGCVKTTSSHDHARIMSVMI